LKFDRPDSTQPAPFTLFRFFNHTARPTFTMSSTTRRTQTRSTPRAHIPRRRPRSRSPDPTPVWLSTLSTGLGGGQASSPTPLQTGFIKRSRKRENQIPATSASNHNSSRGHQNELNIAPVARGDKSKVKPLSSKSRHTTNQSTDALSSTRTAVPGRRDRDRSLTRGESGRSSRQTSSVEPIEAGGDPQLTGPIAVAQYTRLQNEVEKSREARPQHVMIGIY
jgi:hypothetical protein